MTERPEKSEWSEQDEQAFSELIESMGFGGDTGIQFVDTRIREISKCLRKKYALGDQALNYKEVEYLEYELNGEWQHHDDLAWVSGRLYLTDEDLEDTIPESWGECFLDENNRRYYQANDVQLRSRGIQIETIVGDGEEPLGLYVGYVFALNDDDDYIPVAIAHPDDVYRHEYDFPTLKDVRFRLERDYPDAFDFLERIVQPAAGISTLDKLQLIEQHLQADMRASADFCKLVEQYIIHAFPLDQQLPYVATIENGYSYFELEDPKQSDEKGDWIDFTFEGATSLMAAYPKVQVQHSNTARSRILVCVLTYNTEDGDDAEKIRIWVNSLQEFRSTRALHSLVARAVMDTRDDVTPHFTNSPDVLAKEYDI